MTGREQLQAWIARARYPTNRLAADFLGLDETDLSKYLAGTKTPGLANAALIQERTGIPAVSWVDNQVGKSKPRLLRLSHKLVVDKETK